VVAPVLSRLSLRTGRITVRESLSYAGYPSRELLFDRMGYGKPPEDDARRSTTEAAGAFRSTATLLAKALDLPLGDVEGFREIATTDKDLDVAAGVIPTGTVAAIKHGARAECGPIELVIEHITWMDEDAATDWSAHEGYEIEFDGEPTLRCTLVLGTNGENRTEMGCLATAMHAVHMIPVLRAAQSGVLDLADLQH
jgi:hypothetical protein